ncbi:NAD(P)-binding protein [Qipengyuania aquimaris]|uniref:NAD(P)-binding protein n=1 Tax=Qipengyuania aquimaris TaxID=255984 RepID=UPI001FD4EE3D|nr:FAD/NAD(P)-binding protein [Qipengyuania aquimaris]UOR16455.1 NAD(P)/FAD-dependent oxidoreductase [Qipengyuania aquimaris]
MTLETDYLVIGAGATALSFVDTLLAQDPDCDVVMVDKHASPGGHWNDAYSFVALHQPSATYGVESVPLGQDRIDESGPNKGFYELASGPEVLAYFQSVMRDHLLPTGRVRYFPNCEYLGDNRFRNVLSGEEHEVEVRRKLVDTTYFATSVPATHERKFEVADGVRVEIPGKLPELWRSAEGIPEHFVILGAGKTAMDAGVWLLEAGIPPERISWVKPRESWLINRTITQPGEEFFESTVGGQIAIMKAAAKAESVSALFHQLEQDGAMLRIDQSVEPEMFHYATISEGEVEGLRKIGNVIRKGRVERIEPGRMILQQGEREVPEDTLFIDCTASAVRPKPVSPQWENGSIRLQLLHVPLVTLNAAVTAFVEANFETDEEKNALCKPVSFVDDIEGYAGTLLGTGQNRFLWATNEKISAFLSQSRLDPGAPTVRWLKQNAPQRLAVAAEMPAVTMAAIPNLQKLVAQAEAKRG